MQTLDTDYLVIGSGIAGLTFALRAAKHGKVLVVTKSELAESNTRYAQGGISAAVGEDDSLELHVEDTLKAGAGLCDEAAVEFLVSNAETRLEWLQSIGAEFDVSLGREGGHSRNRIVRRADQTGWEIERALTVAVRKEPNIRILEYAFCESLATKAGRCTGAFVRPKDESLTEIRAKATCLATGSCCRVYRFTTNPPIATGDGVALASSAGAKIENMEFIQFHPTTLYHRTRRGFLISEAVRGEGAILRNLRGRRFMFDYDERGELAPRDIVARAIHSEILREGVPFVHLDMTHLSREEIESHFPFIAETLAGLGINVTQEPIPVVPAAHYQCGGVTTNLNGLTTLRDLYGAGEVACTGVHGANRLASNSLLEAVVFGWSAADHAITHADRIESGESTKPKLIGRQDAEGVVRRLRQVMWQHAGIVRKTRGLEHAKAEIEEMIAEAEPACEFYVAGAEASNQVECGRLIVKAALERKFNVGLHYNADLGPPWESAARDSAAPNAPTRVPPQMA